MANFIDLINSKQIHKIQYKIESKFKMRIIILFSNMQINLIIHQNKTCYNRFIF